jgi:RimJ/RimL family protein N-acetyltransferase
MRETVHITLRDYQQADIATIHQLLNNFAVSRFLSSRIPFPYSHADAVWWVNTGSKQEITRVIEFDQQLAGIIGVIPGRYENRRCGELGYWLGQPFWGKGLATLAVKAMTDLIFTQTAIVRLFAPIYGPNKASMRVAEKSGYHLEGIAEQAIFKDGHFFDEYIYARLKAGIRQEMPQSRQATSPD